MNVKVTARDTSGNVLVEWERDDKGRLIHPELPPQVAKMLSKDGLYGVHSRNENGVDGLAPVAVIDGVAYQLTIVSALVEEGWGQNVRITGPLNMETPLLEP